MNDVLGTVLGPAGEVKLTVIRNSDLPVRRSTLRDIIADGLPAAGLPESVNAWRARNTKNLWRGAKRVLVARAMGLPHFYGSLRGQLLTPDGEYDLGLMSLRVVTTAGVNRLVDGLQASSTDVSLWKYHGFGTSTQAEASGDTALIAEVTNTVYATNARPTGTQTEGASANIYRTVATFSPDSGGTLNITEHGVFTADASGVLLDRSVFTAVPIVASSDSLQVTYELTIAAGS